MTREEFEQLAGAGVILLDGATGSNLTKAGMPKGVSTELWVLEHPDILANLQKAYVEAGSQIVYAPTFGANRLKLADYGRENEVEELNARLVDISKKALAGTGALIAGDFSTPGKMLQPKGDLSYEELLESYTGSGDDAERRRNVCLYGCCTFCLRSADYVFSDAGSRRFCPVRRKRCGSS